MFWMKIENLPDLYKTSRRMFIVKAFSVFPTEQSVMPYTTDPYCVWYENGDFVRWPHKFTPTHYAILPEEREV